MKFQKRVLKFEFDGNNYELNYPNVKQVLSFQEEQSKENGYAPTFKLLADLGLPENISDEMEINHIVTIMEILTDSEKKEEKK